jgi:UDP-N-acetylmuramoyl-L-alanyl-D-glutamate--2,6-diaminopimelate ligase
VRKIKNFFHFLKGVFWVVKCGWPGKKLYMIGVTGTDGKTTTCSLIYEVLKAAGIKVGMITTVGVKYLDIEVEKGLHSTNPGPEVLQPLLKKMLEAGVTHVVLEVTSHGLDQNRVWGIPIKIGVLTNITHEHLDYHKTMEAYRQTKLKLFKRVEYAVLNEDDPSFERFRIQVSRFNNKIIPYVKTKIKEISPNLAGEYNKYNIGAAEKVGEILSIQHEVIQRIVKSFVGVVGRRQEVPNKKGIRVIVDFAHTPNALGELLKSLRYHPTDSPLNLRGENQPKHKIILVFGCTGERDKEKRPIMGKIASELADVVIVTSDDTRSEKQDEIAAQIISGITFQPHPFDSPLHNYGEGVGERLFKENDRRKAIEMAIKMAKKGDTVILAGKGHEKTILHGKTEYPWSDVEVARQAMI